MSFVDYLNLKDKLEADIVKRINDIADFVMLLDKRVTELENSKK